VESAREVLTALVGRYAFGEVAALVAAGAGGTRWTAGQAAQARHLCAFGQRLIELDAEDFGEPEPGVPVDLVARARLARMPQAPDEQPRGAMGSLVPAYRLLLEVIAARWVRREMSALVAMVHITSEYLPLLVWESTLGHAGDPARIERSVGGRGSRFGDYHEHGCPHSGAPPSATTTAAASSRGWRRPC
jgi:hypothetical protein